MNAWKIIVISLYSCFVVGCSLGAGTNSNTNDGTSSAITLGTLPDGTKVNISSNNMPVSTGKFGATVLSLSKMSQSNYTFHFANSTLIGAKISQAATDPNGITVNTDPEPCALGTGPLSCSIRITVSANTPAGTYAITPSATSSGGQTTVLSPITILVSASQVSNSKAITTFLIDGTIGVINGHNIAVTLPFGTNVTNLIATYVTTGAKVAVGSTIQDNGITANDFTNPVVYTVTAADGSTTTYTVTVTVAANPSKSLTFYSINGIQGTITGQNIAVTVPFGTDVTNLIASYISTGTTVTVDGISQTSGVTMNNFTFPVIYTVTAADGSTATYTVTVTEALNTAKALTSYSLNGTPGVITGQNIAVTVPFGTDITALIATFNMTGTEITINGTVQRSGLTANNFSAPVSYTVIAADGSSTTYTVTVTVALNTAKAINEYSLNGIPGVITGQNIAVTVPFGTDVTALTATFSTTGIDVKANGVSQTSGLSINNFAAPVIYTAIAADGSSTTYTVTVTVALNSAKALTAYSLNGTPGVISGQNIAVTMPFGTDITALIATFSTTGAQITINGTEQNSGSSANNFSAPVSYTVIAADGSSTTYTVTVTVALNPAKAINEFSLNGTPGVITGQNIAVTVPFGTDITALTASFSTTGANVAIDGTNQTSGLTANNFTDPVTYTVTAADGSTATYTVTVTVALNTAKAINEFSLNGTPGVISGQNIAITVPFGTDITALTASFSTTGANVAIDGTNQTSGLTANNFTDPVTYRVTAADGSTATYIVTVAIALNPAKALTAYSLNGTPGVITGQNIAVTMPYGTDITGLTATFSITGAYVLAGGVIQTSGLSANNFTNPVLYTVIAADGSFTTYTVTVTVALNSAKAINEYSLNGTTGVISGQNIAVTMPYGTDITSLVATFSTTGANVLAGVVIQTSGLSANNFTNPVLYTVIAADGSFTTYTVTVTVALNPAKALTAYSLNGSQGVITGQNIAVTVPFGTDITALTATFSTTGTDVAVNGTNQTSGLTANDFSNPIAYVVTAADGSTATYTVTVTVALNPAKAINEYSLNGTPGVISGQNIAVTVPFGTDVTALTATFTTTGANVTVSGVNQHSSLTANNFTNPVTYRVTAADGSTVTYIVTVTVAPNSAKALTAYSLNGTPGVINGQNITVEVPFGTDITALTATFTTTGSSVTVNGIEQTSSLTANNFTTQVVYTVMAADGSSATYTVTVTVALNTAKALTEYSLNGYPGTITGQNISVTLPKGTAVTALTATFSTTGAEVLVDGISQTSGLSANDFTNPVLYTVMAADGSSTTYTVIVTAQAFEGYYPLGCTINNTGAGVVGDCICIRDTTTYDVWLVTPSAAEMSWNGSTGTPPGANNWANNLNSGAGTCGFTSGWKLPTRTQLDTMLSYVRDLSENRGDWFNNNGFVGMDNLGTYWGDGDDLSASILFMTLLPANVAIVLTIDSNHSGPHSYGWAVNPG